MSADAVDVEAARGDVGGDEHLRAARAEAFDRGGAILLRCDRRGSRPRAGPIARSCRASRSAPIFVLTNTIVGSCDAPQVLREERRPSRAPAAIVRFVRDRLRRAAARSDLHEHRVRRERVGEAHHFFRHRRREEHRLPRGGRRQRLGDAADVGPEAHVHHAVGFVEHEHLELREVADAAAHVIEQPARRGDDDVDAGLEGALLRLHRHAAVDGDARDGRVIREALDLVVDLRRELARRREDQRARRMLRGARRRPRDPRGAAARGSAARTRRSCPCRFRRSR